MYYSAGWQLLEDRIDDDSPFTPDPLAADVDRHVQYVWGVRYVDDIILHREDAGADGSYEKTFYHLTDVQFSTVAVIDGAAGLVERITYTAYGQARHHYMADVDGDGDVEKDDLYDIRGTANGPAHAIGQANYDADQDVNRDGDVTLTDYTIAVTEGTHPALALGLISDSAVDNQIGWDGYVFNAETQHYHVRYRCYDPVQGRWLERDPISYVGGMNLYEYVAGSPVLRFDPLGLLKRSTAKDIVNGFLSRLEKFEPGDTSGLSCTLRMLYFLANQNAADWLGDVGLGIIFAPIKALPAGILGKISVGGLETIINAVRSGGITEEGLIDLISSTFSQLLPSEAKKLAKAISEMVKTQLGDALGGEGLFVAAGADDAFTRGEQSIECTFFVTAKTRKKLGGFGGEVVIDWQISGTCRYKCEKYLGRKRQQCCPCGTGKVFTVTASGTGKGINTRIDDYDVQAP